MSNPAQADAHINHGRRARQAGNVEGVKQAVCELSRLLPSEDPDRNRYGSGLMR